MAKMIDTRYKSARDIEKMLRQWALEGRIKSKTLMGREYSKINKQYAIGELLVTSMEGIDVLNENDRHIFEELREAKRLLSKREVMLYNGLTSEYQIKKAVERGELIRFDLLGKTAIIYIK